MIYLTELYGSHLTDTQLFSLVMVRALRGVTPWLAMLRDDLAYTTDALPA